MDEFTPHSRDVTVVELLDRLVDHGVVLSGDISISVADVDLIEIGLRLLIRTPDTGNEDGTSHKESTERREDLDDAALRLRPFTDWD